MAAQVLSGSGNVSYTNSTGQNVRVVINYLENSAVDATLTFQGVSVTIDSQTTYGKTLAYRNSQTGGGNENQDMAVDSGPTQGNAKGGIPVEFALSNGGTFSITNPSSSAYIKGYNIIIIPEAG